MKEIQDKYNPLTMSGEFIPVTADMYPPLMSIRVCAPSSIQLHFCHLACFCVFSFICYIIK